MNQDFDIFDRAEKPPLTLCNPDKTEIFSIDMSYDVVYDLRFNAMNELNFTISKVINNDLVEAYDFIKMKRVVLLGDLDYFEIINVDENKDGTVDIKQVQCRSLEVKQISKRIVGFVGTYQFYDPISPEGTLIQEMLDRLPSWSVGSIDSSLWSKFRTFSIDDNNIYNFLMDDVSTAYECIFEFDTINNEISAYTLESAVTETDIYLSFNNLIKNGKLVDKDEEVTTCLSVFGAGNLDIRTVNPLGGNTIYDFSYYATIDWMTQDLIDAIDAWEVLIDASQSTYADLLTSLKEDNATLVEQQTELVELQNDYLALEGVQKARIENNSSYEDINVLLEDKQAEIDALEGEITTTQGNIDNTTVLLENINTLLSFDNNFTDDQYTTLSEFFFENTYQNENFVQTDIMTQDEIQEVSQTLYDQGVDVLGRLSQPRFELSIEGVNFLMLKEFEEFANQAELGAEITVELDDGTIGLANILAFSMAYDNPQDFVMSLSNRLRLDNESFTFSDLVGQTIKTGNTVNFERVGWNNWETSHKDDVTTFIESALDATVNNVINAENQEIIINQNGLRGRQLISEGVYSPEQAWLTSSILAFTRDNWETASAALGRVDVNGTDYYGLVADVVVGRMLAGNQLTITNEDNNFLLDNTGAYLTDATLYLQTSNNKNRISIDPENGILIESNLAGTWEDQFKVDSSGNVIFSGNLQGASGTFSGNISATSGDIGGWHINSNSLYDDLGNYIRSNGQVKLGALLINGAVARFDGDIYADNLIGNVVDSQIDYGLNAAKVGYGNMSGDRIYGGTMGGDAGDINLDGNQDGYIDIIASAGVNVAGAVATFSGNFFTQILSNQTLLFDAPSVSFNNISTFNINGNFGSTDDVFVSQGALTKRMSFHKGIFTGWSYV